MPPRRRAAAPPPIDVESVRKKLAEGKIVRVGITRSAQFPDGGTGRVRQVGDPAVDGDEYVQVELSLNGTRDILPFTPADLTPAVRGRPPAQFPDTPGRVPLNGRTGRPIPTAGERRPHTQKAGVTPTDAEISSDPLFPAAPAEAPGQSPAPASSPGTTADGPEGKHSTPSATPATPRAKPARGARRTPAVSITVATTSFEPVQWRIDARVGTKVAVRSAVVSPARVWEFVRLLDNEALNKAVGSILDDQRSAAQARADALAVELAQVRAELEALPRAGG